MSFYYPTKTVFKIQPTYTVGYKQWLDNYSRSLSRLPLLNKHNGSVSNKSSTKIRNAVNWMLFFSKKKKVYSIKERSTFYFYLNFITLTLPSTQHHSDDFLKENLLVPFLDWMKRTNGNEMYVWKAESQRNGNIHFHITSHVFIHWKSIRKKWNVLLSKHGYCKTYQDGSNDKGDASTQVKAAKNPEQVGGYLAAYIGKDDRLKLKIKTPKLLPKFYKCSTFSDTALNYDYSMSSPLKRPVTGRLWGCSYNLSRISVTIDEEDYGIDEFTDICEDIDTLVESKKSEKYYTLYLYRNLKYKSLPSHVALTIKHSISLSEQKTFYSVDSLLLN